MLQNWVPGPPFFDSRDRLRSRLALDVLAVGRIWEYYRRGFWLGDPGCFEIDGRRATLTRRAIK